MIPSSLRDRKKETMMKKIIAALMACLLLFSLSACAVAEEPVRLAALKGPTAMGLVQLLDTQEGYDFLLAGAATEIVPLFNRGEIDIAAVPVTLISTLYNNPDVKDESKPVLIAINALGVLYVVEKGGESIQSVADLKGKTLYATGKGNTPEYTLTYLLQANGLDINSDVTVEWKTEPAEVVALMAQQEQAVAMLPQPYVTVAGNQLQGLRVALDLTAEWDQLENGSRLITAGIMARRGFAQQHPEQVNAFLQAYAASAAYVNENVAEAAQLIEKYDIVKAAVAQKALPQCNIVCIAGEEMQAVLPGYLQTLLDLNPAAIGGKLPESDFYWLNESN